MRPSLFKGSGVVLGADAVSCYIKRDKKSKVEGSAAAASGDEWPLKFCCFVVEFWAEEETKVGSIFTVEIQGPSHWSADRFLEVFLDDFENHKPVISLINSYYINGIGIPFNTINTMHHKFLM